MTGHAIPAVETERRPRARQQADARLPDVGPLVLRKTVPVPGIAAGVELAAEAARQPVGVVQDVGVARAELEEAAPVADGLEDTVAIRVEVRRVVGEELL